MNHCHLCSDLIEPEDATEIWQGELCHVGCAAVDDITSLDDQAETFIELQRENSDGR